MSKATDSLVTAPSRARRRRRARRGQGEKLHDEIIAATERLHAATREVASLEAALKALQDQQERLDTDSKLKDWAEKTLPALQHHLDMARGLKK